MTRREEGHDEFEHLRSASGFSRIFEAASGGTAYLLGVGKATCSLYEGEDRSFHFDLEGRLRRASTPGLHYLRGLDGRVLRKTDFRRLPPESREAVKALEMDEALAVFENTHRAVRAASEALADPAAREFLERAAYFDPERLLEESRRFAQVYAPLSILPPDRYRALILQATVGCSYGKCLFCSLYRGVPYRRKSREEFRRHISGVKAFLGRALCLKSGVFLGEANALELPVDDLESLLQLARRELPAVVAPGAGRRGGVSSFSDVFHGECRSRRELERLAALGLDRVYLGVESGDDAVLRRLRKPASRDAARLRVRDLKQAGISVGLIFLVGAGGKRLAQGHVEGSVSFLAGLDLDDRDIVYLSPLYVERGGDLETDALDAGELEAEERELRTRLRALGLRVSRYDMKSFVYY